jgi:hypothetical protein
MGDTGGFQWSNLGGSNKGSTLDFGSISDWFKPKTKPASYITGVGSNPMGYS